MRNRTTFQISGTAIRVCTPFVVWHRNSVGGVNLGIAMGYDEIFRELRLMEYLATHGPEERINLQRLADASTVILAPYCYRVKHSWLLSHRTHHRIDSWERSVRKLIRSPEHRELDYQLDDLVAEIDQRQTHRTNWDAVLHVPIDMTKPIEEQLERHRSYLVKGRQYLYRYTRSAPPRDKTRTTWRDIYIYLLSKLEQRPTAKIAEEVFPNEHKRSRQLKVRMIIRDVDSVASKVELWSKSRVKEISPPA